MSQMPSRMLGLLASVVLLLPPNCHTPWEVNRNFHRFVFRSLKGVRLYCSINVFNLGIHEIVRGILSNGFLFQGHLELFLERGWLSWLHSASDRWHLSYLFQYICCVFPAGADRMDLFSSQDECLCPRFRVWMRISSIDSLRA